MIERQFARVFNPNPLFWSDGVRIFAAWEMSMPTWWFAK